MPYPEETLNILEGNIAHLTSNPPDLSAGQTPGVLVIHCNDSRVLVNDILKQPLGEDFTKENIAGVVQPVDEIDRSLNAFLNYPLLHMDSIHTILVMGHTQCGGINALTQQIIHDASREHGDLEEWLLPLTTDALSKAVKHAHEHGASVEEIAEVVEQVMPLLSAKRLQERILKDNGTEHNVGNILNTKHITVVPCVYDLQDHHLRVFDYDGQQYRTATELTRSREEKTPTVEAFASGANTRTVAEFPMQEIDLGIKRLLESIEQLGGHGRA